MRLWSEIHLIGPFERFVSFVKSFEIFKQKAKFLKFIWSGIAVGLRFSLVWKYEINCNNKLISIRTKRIFGWCFFLFIFTINLTKGIDQFLFWNNVKIFMIGLKCCCSLSLFPYTSISSWCIKIHTHDPNWSKIDPILIQ